MTKTEDTLRTSEPRTAKPFRVLLGARLSHVRGSRSQELMATLLGVHKNTYARWERDEREIGADALLPLVNEGWNVNWLLTGQGPERLEQSQPGVEASQPARLDGAMMGRALAAVRRLLQANGFHASDEGEGELAAILYEMYQHGMAWEAAEHAVSTLMRTTTSRIGKEKQGSHERQEH